MCLAKQPIFGSNSQQSMKKWKHLGLTENGKLVTKNVFIRCHKVMNYQTCKSVHKYNQRKSQSEGPIFLTQILRTYLSITKKPLDHRTKSFYL